MIVGIGHVARVGKDTCAEGLVRDLGFRRAGFADVLKQLAEHADPIIQANAVTNVGIGSGKLKKLVRSVGGWDRAKDMFPPIREFLQNLGDGGRTLFGEDFWMDQVLGKIRADERVVIPDVRFMNEFDAIRKLGGKLIRVDRPGHSASGHVSETELTTVPNGDWDAVIQNDAGVLDLQAAIVETVRPWLRGQGSAT